MTIKTKVKRYPGTENTVTWDLARCIHARECVDRLPEVFDPGQRPWISPDRSGSSELARTIAACPTGALGLAGVSPLERPAEPNLVTVVPDGPLYLRGKIEVLDHSGTAELCDSRVALCRCGLSRNKPLCDGRHEEGFQDPGTLGKSAAGATVESPGVVSVKPAPDGPLLLEGNVVLSGSGELRPIAKAALCRCGASGNKPFCDGSHRNVGFTDG